MFDDDKVLIISNNHNHRPPFLLRNENGTLVSSYLMRAEPKNRKKEKAALGPVATHDQVHSLVASIMKSCSGNENNNDTAAICTRNVTPEIGNKVCVSDYETPKNIKSSVSEIINTEANTDYATPKTDRICNDCLCKNKTRSEVTTGKKNEPLEIVTNHSQTNPANEVLEGSNFKNETVFSQINLDKDHLVSREVQSVPLMQHDTGSLIPNQLYIVVPNNDAGVPIHNRFIIPYQNPSGLLYNNRVLLTPIKTEPTVTTTVTWRNQIVQTSNNLNFPAIRHAVPQQTDSTVVLNKTILLLHHNNINAMTPRINENMSLVPTTIETGVSNETYSSVANKMFIIMQNQNETSYLPVTNAQPEHNINNTTSVPPKETIAKNHASNNMQNIPPRKLQMKTSIPIASIKNIKFPNKPGMEYNNLYEKSDTVIGDGNIVPNKNDTNSDMVNQLQNISTVLPNKPKTDNISQLMQSYKMEVDSVMTSKVHTPSKKPVIVESCNKQPLTPKKAETEIPVSSKTQPISPTQTGSVIVTNSLQSITLKKTEIALNSISTTKIKPIALKKTDIGNIRIPQVLQHKVEQTAKSLQSFESIGKKANNAVPNKQQTSPRKMENYGVGYTKIQQAEPKKMESIEAGSSKVQQIMPKKLESSVAGSNKMQQVSLKNVKSSVAGFSMMEEVALNKTELNDAGSSDIQQLTPKKMESNVTGLSKMQQATPIKFELRIAESSKTQQAVAKMLESCVAGSSKMHKAQPIKIESRVAGPNIMQQAMPKKIESSLTSSKLQQGAPIKFESNISESSKIQQAVPKQLESSVPGSSKINKIESSVAGTSRMQQAAPKKTESSVAGSIRMQQVAPKKIESRVAESSKMQQAVPKKLESSVAGSSKMQQAAPKKIESSVAGTSRMQQAALKKTESSVAGSSRMQQAAPKKTESSVAETSKTQRAAPKKNESSVAGCSKMQQEAPKKTESNVVGSSKMQQKAPKKTEFCAVGHRKMQPKELKKAEFSCSTASKISVPPKQFDGWVIPKIKHISKPETAVRPCMATDVKQATVNKTLSKEVTQTPVPPMSVSMIPLPNDMSGLSGNSGVDVTLNNTGSQSQEVPPPTMEMGQRLLLKHKAGSNMHSVPPKKRHYQG